MNLEPALETHPGSMDLASPSAGQKRQRILLESTAIVLVVALLATGLVWLRRSGGPGIDPLARQSLEGTGLIQDLPTAVPSQPPATIALAVAALNTPHAEAPPPIELAAQAPAVASGGPQADAPDANGATLEQAAPAETGQTGQSQSLVYEIKSGDTLIGIAIDHGVTLDAIVQANDITDMTGFHVGDKLSIPVEGEVMVAQPQPEVEPAGEQASAASEAPKPIVVRAQEVYRVQPGDDLEGIAASHNVPLKDLLDANSFADGKVSLKAGQDLVIRPAQLATATPLPSGTAIPEQGAPAVAVESGAALMPAPMLLGPGPDSTITDEALLMRWSSVGILPQGHYYVVSMRDITARSAKEAVSDGQPQAERELPDIDLDSQARHEWVLSNATALRVPPDFRPVLGAKRVIEWSVSVRQLGPSGSDGIRTAQKGREVRRFTWLPGALGDTESTD